MPAVCTARTEGREALRDGGLMSFRDLSRSMPGEVARRAARECLEASIHKIVSHFNIPIEAVYMSNLPLFLAISADLFVDLCLDIRVCNFLVGPASRRWKFVVLPALRCPTENTELTENCDVLR